MVPNKRSAASTRRITNAAQDPPEGYTDKDWQRDLLTLKSQAYAQQVNSLGGYNDTYRIYLDSVLYQVRSGGVDYCLHPYQVLDLLRQEENLQSRWLKKERLFRVWL